MAHLYEAAFVWERGSLPSSPSPRTVPELYRSATAKAKGAFGYDGMNFVDMATKQGRGCVYSWLPASEKSLRSVQLDMRRLRPADLIIPLFALSTSAVAWAAPPADLVKASLI